MRTMLRLAATRDELRVVDDQRGAPTSSAQLARATLELFVRGEGSRAITARDVARVKDAPGLYHATAAGETTWFGFAQAIFAARALRDARLASPRLIPITTRDYPTTARRPAYSVLSNARLADTFGVRLPPWRDGVAEALSTVSGA
jgi:dTDP-4-dehydrorhamnose reductase